MMRTMRALAGVVALVGTIAIARAQQPQPSPTPASPPVSATPSTPSPTAPTQPRAEPAKPPSSSGDFNFDLGNEKKTPESQASEQERIAKLERKVHLRRALLQWHQALGFATLALLAITDTIGTLNYYDKYTAGGTDTGTFTTWHEGLGIGTASLFAVTGVLALAAPNPYPKPVKLDAALLHKLSMLMATACFAAQIVMGPIMAVSDGKLYQKDLALAHLVVGWSAFAFMGVGTLAFVF
jgi:cytochrome b561